MDIKRVNNVVRKMSKGEKAYGMNMIFPSTTIVELAGRAGFDFVTFDSEHGPFTIDILDDLCRVADMAGLTPFARIPNIDDSTILRFLDRGIMGITGPHIVNGTRAKQLAAAARYVPRGRRSFGSSRGAYYGGPPSGKNYMNHINNHLLVTAQLEDVQVLDNLDDIFSVDGIDLYASGAQDIAQSMGIPGHPTHPDVLAFEKEVRKQVHAAGKKMADEVMPSARAVSIFMEGSKAYLEAQKGS